MLGQREEQEGYSKDRSFPSGLCSGHPPILPSLQRTAIHVNWPLGDSELSILELVGGNVGMGDKEKPGSEGRDGRLGSEEFRREYVEERG